MGKIRVKTLGDETAEQEQKKEAKKRKEAKKVTKVPGMKGGERVVTVGPSEEELAALEKPATTEDTEKDSGKQLSQNSVKTVVAKKAKKEKFAKPRKSRSKKYQTVASLVDKHKQYPLSKALEMLPKIGMAKFDETVELHINTTEDGIAGEVTLPHGSGKQIRVAIVDDAIIANIEKGKIDFDVLLAEPQMMPKLAKVAKVLGPKGLMPNPKNGTITQNPQEATKKYQGGLIRFKSEAKLPVMHLTVGKVSFGEKKLAENIKTAIDAVQQGKIKNITLKSTMSPGIKLEFTNI